jgi:hypothetical protein
MTVKWRCNDPRICFDSEGDFLIAVGDDVHAAAAELCRSLRKSGLDNLKDATRCEITLSQPMLQLSMADDMTIKM